MIEIPSGGRKLLKERLEATANEIHQCKDAARNGTEPS
jgi:hypothetical protein